MILCSMAAFFAGIYQLRTRNRILEKMAAVSKSSKAEKPAVFSAVGESVEKLLKKVGWSTDFEQIDKKLFLAKRPLNLFAQEFIGAWVIMVAVVMIIAVVLCFTGAVPPFVAVLVTLFAVMLPHLVVTNSSDEGREKLSTEVIELVSKMELGVSAGLSPTRVLEWAAEGEGMLAAILKTANKEISMGKMAYAVFNKIAEDYGVPEARDVAVSLKQAEIQGLNIAQVLVELARDMRDRRERDAEIQVVKLKPTLEGIMTAMVMVAAITLMIGPLVAENMGVLDMMISKDF
ncbi:type II secretion system F family protein [Pelotomaculum propionicicum]|uniref:type II secretion system F family protein n=1 Tax=Pelotomaculum propionicicum TaxID=258475 RepID=UPI003BA0DDA3